MPTVTTDPVCGAELNQEDVEERSEYEGQVFYFCSAVCRNRFEENPGQFTSRADRGSGGEAT